MLIFLGLWFILGWQSSLVALPVCLFIRFAVVCFVSAALPVPCLCVYVFGRVYLEGRFTSIIRLGRVPHLLIINHHQLPQIIIMSSLLQ